MYGRAYTSFRLPAMEEYFSSFTGSFARDLKSEKASGYEFGAKHYFWKRSSVGGRVFVINMADEIMWNSTLLQNQNMSETQHVGLDMESTLELAPWADVVLSFSFMQAEFSAGQYNGKDVPLVPNFAGNIGLILRPWESFLARIQFNHVGERVAGGDFNNDGKKLEGYTTMDLYFNFKVTEEFEVFINANNILDEKYSDYGYYSIWTGNTYYPMPGTNIFLGVRVGM